MCENKKKINKVHLIAFFVLAGIFICLLLMAMEDITLHTISGIAQRKNISSYQTHTAEVMPTAETENIIYTLSTGDSTGLYTQFPTEFSTNAVENTEPAQKWRYTLTEYEISLIVYIISFEDSDFDALTACAEVVLNRVESERFPDTVEDVIFQWKQFYGSRFIKKGAGLTVDEESDEYQAVISVFRDGVSLVEGALFFANENVKPNSIANSLYEVGRYGKSKYWGQE